MDYKNIKVSVITINFNNREGLKKTMESVFSQTFQSLEYIVIDGGSTDGSNDLIAKHSTKIDYCVSEKDKGIMDAHNKGIVKATGEYVILLNSGDYFISPEVLTSVFSPGFSEDILYGDLSTENRVISYPQKVNASFFLWDSLPHPSSFIKRKLFDEHGLYNEASSLVSDWEFFLKVVVLHGATYRHIDQVITFFNSEGTSTNPENAHLYEQERLNVLTPLFPTLYPEIVKELIELNQALSLYNNSKAISMLKKVINSKAYQMLK